ncbi:glycosyltransferase family 4 protein [Vibrio diabolicus]|uniref:glycosyltransferase family 4 protein n=1 Tax=Vibrio diabolicus TaxID=50719 RepID=UPI0024951BFB|nr:glycosyltransferase family 4 protein [Vibrio diabolicus]
MSDSKCVLLTSNTSWYLYNFRKNTIIALIQKGVRVVCAAPKDSYSEKLEELGASFIAIPMIGKSTNPIYEMRSLFYIFRMLLRLKPFFVYNFTIKMNLYFGLLCRFLSIPYANNVSGLGTVFLHDKLIFKLVKKLYGFVNNGGKTVFFQNQEDHDLFVSAGLAITDKSTILPGSGVDVEHFNFHHLPEKGPFTFTMVARLIADKGIREYVAAARKVKQLYPDVHFILVGPSGISNKTAITDSEIEQWQREQVVEWVGEQADIKPWIINSHVFVLPSYREGMPKTVLEAAAIGRPAIVTDVPGCRQSIVNGRTGWLCQVKSADSLAETMMLVLATSSEELAFKCMEARKRVEHEFTEKIVIDHYLACLDI